MGNILEMCVGNERNEEALLTAEEERKAFEAWKQSLLSTNVTISLVDRVFNIDGIGADKSIPVEIRTNLVPAKLNHLVKLGVDTSPTSCLEWCLNSDLKHDPNILVKAVNILVAGGLESVPKDTMGILTKIALGDGKMGAKAIIAMGLSLKGIDINAETIEIKCYDGTRKDAIYAPVYYAEMRSLETTSTTHLPQIYHDRAIAIRKEVFEMLKENGADYVTPEQRKANATVDNAEKQKKLSIDLIGRLFNDDEGVQYEIKSVECFDDGDKIVNDVDGKSWQLDYVQSHLISKD